MPVRCRRYGVLKTPCYHMDEVGELYECGQADMDKHGRARTGTDRHGDMERI